MSIGQLHDMVKTDSLLTETVQGKNTEMDNVICQFMGQFSLSEVRKIFREMLKRNFFLTFEQMSPEKREAAIKATEWYLAQRSEKEEEFDSQAKSASIKYEETKSLQSILTRFDSIPFTFWGAAVDSLSSPIEINDLLKSLDKILFEVRIEEVYLKMDLKELLVCLSRPIPELIKRKMKSYLKDNIQRLKGALTIEQFKFLVKILDWATLTKAQKKSALFRVFFNKLISEEMLEYLSELSSKNAPSLELDLMLHP